MYVLETAIGSNDDVAYAEASCIARWIRHAVESRMLVDDGGRQRPALYGDFLLVSDRKARLQFYAQALEAESIRYEVTGSEAFAKSDDLRSVMPLLRVVADTDDSVSLVAFLRGPFCGASDDAPVRERGERFAASASRRTTPIRPLRQGSRSSATV